MNKYIPNLSNFKFKKFRKKKDYIINKTAYKLNHLNFGFYGLKSLENSFIDPIQIEACRRTIVRKLKRKGKLWINCYPYKPLTSKGHGTRMGKGKGLINKWVYPVYKGDILFELSFVNSFDANIALNAAAMKLGFSCKFIKQKIW